MEESREPADAGITESGHTPSSGTTDLGLNPSMTQNRRPSRHYQRLDDNTFLVWGRDSWTTSDPWTSTASNPRIELGGAASRPAHSVAPPFFPRQNQRRSATREGRPPDDGSLRECWNCNTMIQWSPGHDLESTQRHLPRLSKKPGGRPCPRTCQMVPRKRFNAVPRGNQHQALQPRRPRRPPATATRPPMQRKN